MGKRVRKYNWVDGQLTAKEYFFKDLKEAVKFANDAEDQTVKVFDEQDDLIHHVENKEIVMSADE